MNPLRFSTKYQDDETGLLYYGHRYLNTSTGSWNSRDPLAEPGFASLQNVDASGDTSNPNLYNFVANNAISAIDLIGLKFGDPPGEIAFPPYNPVPIGQKCCCKLPTARLYGRRTDRPPTATIDLLLYTSWTLHLSVDVLNENDSCYTAVRVDWARCWGPDSLRGYMGSGYSLDVSVSTWNYIGLHPAWVTQARINYLACENGVWTKKLAKAGMYYGWTGSDWEH